MIGVGRRPPVDFGQKFLNLANFNAAKLISYRLFDRFRFFRWHGLFFRFCALFSLFQLRLPRRTFTLRSTPTDSVRRQRISPFFATLPLLEDPVFSKKKQDLPKLPFFPVVSKYESRIP